MSATGREAQGKSVMGSYVLYCICHGLGSNSLPAITTLERRSSLRPDEKSRRTFPLRQVYRQVRQQRLLVHYTTAQQKSLITIQLQQD